MHNYRGPHDRFGRREHEKRQHNTGNVARAILQLTITTSKTQTH